MLVMNYDVRHHIYIGLNKMDKADENTITINDGESKTFSIKDLASACRDDYDFTTFDGETSIDNSKKYFVVIYAPKDVRVSVEGRWIKHHMD